MKMRFSVNEEYANVSGVVNCGSRIVNLADEVKDGVIESDVPAVQQILAELRGTHGRIFKSIIVNDDGTTRELELPEIVQHQEGRNPSDVVAGLAATETQQAQQTPNASGGYDSLPDTELKSLIQQRGLPVPADAEKAELVEILDQADAK
jgi:hypothetical protein